VGFLCSVGRLRAYLGDFGAAHRPPTVKKKNLAFGGSAGGYPVGPWGFGVGGCTPPSAYLVVCAKLRPFGAFQFLPKLPLSINSCDGVSIDKCSSLGRSLLLLWYLPALTKVHRPLLKILLSSQQLKKCRLKFFGAVPVYAAKRRYLLAARSYGCSLHRTTR